MAHGEATNNLYFYEDEVYRIDHRGRVKFGLIMENFEGTPSDSEDYALNKGEVRVIWHPEGKEQILNESQVGLADRTLMPGDVVRRLVPGKDTQHGYCQEISVRADVKVVGTRFVLKNVNAERLRPLVTVFRDNAVCLDSWVGSTKSVHEKLVLRSACGSVLEIRPEAEYCPLKDAESKSRNGLFSSTLFYPGQVLTGPVSALDNAKWLVTSHEMRTSRKHKTCDRKFVVQSVEVEGVWVNWQCKALSEENGLSGIQQPKRYVTGDDLKRLKRLNLFESCMLQINDKSHLKIAEGDAIVRKSQWKREQSNKYKILQYQQRREEGGKGGGGVGGGGRGRGVDQCDTVKLTTTECDLDNTTNSVIECDRSKLCPEGGGRAKERNNETANVPQIDEWQTDNEETDSQSDSESVTTISSCSSNTPKGSPKRSPLLAKKLKRFRKRRTTSVSEAQMPQVGQERVTEALVVYSTVTVVWQDGTIESGIPSTQLYPIHYLDDHEFFPGDFVLSGNENDEISRRDYGVIQTVDHFGRTARVKWFRTYTCIEEPTPKYIGVSEVSVYDLKDHPDFQYRPGTIVIRVANFVGEDASCTAGQVVDNYPEGRVKVWWVDGHQSMCWPQDLFEVGQYDTGNTFWDNDDSDNSWETESEVSELGGSPLNDEITKPQLVHNLERARIAMARLEELFNMNSALQNQSVMRNLLGVYKKCRYLDRLMKTNFFHENNFMGLLERVRRGSSTAERVQDQVNRLFTPSSPPKTTIGGVDLLSPAPRDDLPQVPGGKKNSLEATKSQSHSHDDCSSFSSGSCQSTEPKSKSTGSSGVDTRGASCSPLKNANHLYYSAENWSIAEHDYHTKLISCVVTNIDMAAQNQKLSASHSGRITEFHDSGHFSRTERVEGGSSIDTCVSSSNDLTLSVNGFLKTDDDLKSQSCASIELSDEVPEFVCAKLCALIKAQMVIALQEINNRFSQPSNGLNEVIIEECDMCIPGVDSIPNEPVELGEIAEAMPIVTTEVDLNSSLSEADAGSITAAPVPSDCFAILETAPNTHKYHLTIFHPTNPPQFFRAVQREHKLLRTALPSGVWVRAYEDRVDLFSVMIEGPKNTPYEDGMFLFDIQLSDDYPLMPPLCYYISYCSDRLNPNLYEDGKVCVSLLGTWSGRGSEIWGPDSSLLQVIVSIQGLILVAEPYYNEAGYEKQKGTQQGMENSRMYNEMAVIKLVQSMTKLMCSPPEIFKEQIVRHFEEKGFAMYERIKSWLDLSMEIENSAGKIDPAKLDVAKPDFPLIPASRGFCLTLVNLLESLRKKLETLREH
ncbi:(E3-independent) E2 ubiquitin-conjugating enzyme [Phlebotomus papatasi]|uniref:(E3-independent) E2 ubiquitin-conjugating enzyme n=1 Tax=Phlebotomus papatasi TaxID=29031 RepID=UPI002483F5E7|nr:(E3-independent) E2 ubiquitin-conjugating enzyme [Phlebotomus papatasi]